jgi:UPF0176 protein
MATLHNRVSRKELRQRIRQDNTPRTTLSFYRYVPVADPALLRDAWYLSMNAIGVLGRIYIAEEGVNAQVSVPAGRMDEFRGFLDAQPGFEAMRLNIAVEDDGKSFFLLDIRVRKKIVADGIVDPEFDMRNRGKYVDARRFNELAGDPDTIIVDMRNGYEYEVGHFRDAVEIPSETFREQLPMAVDMLGENRDRNIIMYCTGGIRCEKASAWMLHKGFRNVFHLEGGIINYVRQVRKEGLENRFLGKNFVFDERMGERITDDVLATCHTCGVPCDTHINCANDACHLLFIQCEDCRKNFGSCCSSECMDTRQLPVEMQKEKVKERSDRRGSFRKSVGRRQDHDSPPAG